MGAARWNMKQTGMQIITVRHTIGAVDYKELTEMMVAHMALDTPGSLAWAATSCSYILVWYIMYKST